MSKLKKRTVSLSLIFMILLTGCSPFVENNTIEEIAPVTFWSVRSGENDQVILSTLTPPLLKEKKRVITMQVDLLKQGSKNFNLNYYREIKSGQVRMLIISEDFAKKGITFLINTLLADPDISQRIYLVVVNGNFDEYLQNQLEQEENIDYYLYRMLKHYEENDQGEITIANLHEYKNKLYTSYSDPILPVFKIEDDDFKYDGTGIFRNDKLLYTLSYLEDQIYQIIDNNYYLKFLPLSSFSAVLGQVRSDVKIDLNSSSDILSLNVKLHARLEEYRGDKNLFNEKELTTLTNELEAYFEKQTKELIKKLQDLEADPIEIGKRIKTPFTKPPTEKEWLQKWGKMKVEVSYQLDIEPLTNMKNEKE
ncbi:Ger(x)C family spore germination protein [Bacillus idriensis]|uniref:Ger(X)C family spore germination protein n=1 Tax=Metabacillus idriensis TaxID=324768 RepID=A0A6I2MD16_9BACI|nr:Ger(x)C family spore germination protein [Metabacillus idriensis]MRX56235.1 Ger(x)C family spore germination protein [Metabacillus idriensis]